MLNNDTISRTALLAAYDAAHNGPPGKARKLIEEAPTVDAAPVVHGRWIQCEPHSPLECGECHCFFVRLYPRDFCPHCGAKMEAR